MQLVKRFYGAEVFGTFPQNFWMIVGLVEKGRDEKIQIVDSRLRMA